MATFSDELLREVILVYHMACDDSFDAPGHGSPELAGLAAMRAVLERAAEAGQPCGEVLKPRGYQAVTCDLVTGHLGSHEGPSGKDRWWFDETGHGILRTHHPTTNKPLAPNPQRFEAAPEPEWRQTIGWIRDEARKAWMVAPDNAPTLRSYLGNIIAWCNSIDPRLPPQEAAPTGEKSDRWATENCHMLARRELNRMASARRHGDETTPIGPIETSWQHIIRMCELTGYTPNGPLRSEAAPTAETERTCATCVHAKLSRDITDEYRSWCEVARTDITDVPEDFGCWKHTPTPPRTEAKG